MYENNRKGERDRVGSGSVDKESIEGFFRRTSRNRIQDENPFGFNFVFLPLSPNEIFTVSGTLKPKVPGEEGNFV